MTQKGFGRTWFTSDLQLHFFHKNIVKFTNRGKETTEEFHNEWLLDLWNSTVAKGDVVYHLGDFSFAKDYSKTVEILNKLNGNIHLLKGNHDYSDNFSKYSSNRVNTHQYLEKQFKVGEDKQHVVMFHFPISSFHKQSHGAWHLHGHCVDLNTEILTKTGWKFRNELSTNEEIISYNIESNKMEYDVVSDIIDVNYTGEIIVGKSKSHDFNFTANHTMIARHHPKGKVIKIDAKSFANRNRTTLLSASKNTNVTGIGLSKELLQLHIICTADGSLKSETNLCRIRVKKPHKISTIKQLLNSLNIEYRQYESKGYQSFNFYLPSELCNLPFKGLGKHILDANEEDAGAIFDAYCNSDGHKPTNSNTLIIYSAKENEIDLLQAMFCQNGYHTNKHSRFHGFGKNLQHQLSVTKKEQSVITSKSIKTENVTDTPYWCVKTRNRTWVMRRNGVVQITGNCHGNHQDSKGKMLDVGLDNAYNLYGKHCFFDLEMIEAYMQKQEVYTSDSHRVNI